VGIGGKEHVLRADDMLMRDAAGVISAVLYGPDWRTQLNERTQRALFSTYAPPGVDADSVRSHLELLATRVQLVAPAAGVRLLALYPPAD
jgi:DNA/RNA-binding domain of Phe-tRNA-synthetase-like protein